LLDQLFQMVKLGDPKSMFSIAVVVVTRRGVDETRTAAELTCLLKQKSSRITILMDHYLARDYSRAILGTGTDKPDFIKSGLLLSPLVHTKYTSMKRTFGKYLFHKQCGC